MNHPSAAAFEHAAMPVSSAVAAPAVTDRLHALDAVRGGALMLGVALHASLSYLPGAGAWWIVGDTSIAATSS